MLKCFFSDNQAKMTDSCSIHFEVSRGWICLFISTYPDVECLRNAGRGFFCFRPLKKIGSMFYSCRRDDEMQRGEKKVEKQPKEKGFISSLWRSLILASHPPSSSSREILMYIEKQ